MGQVLNLDDFRPIVTDTMHCLFCGTVHVLKHAAGKRTRYYPCPGCDEVTCVPERTLEFR
jgi:ferredoxin-like protein FixX